MQGKICKMHVVKGRLSFVWHSNQSFEAAFHLALHLVLHLIPPSLGSSIPPSIPSHSLLLSRLCNFDGQSATRAYGCTNVCIYPPSPLS